jgi:mannose-6-phosphate isomerase-like protein (cupin superfamily)
VQLDEAQAVLLRAGDGEVVADRPQRTLRILTDHELLNLTWFRYEPGQEGPDPHVHYTHTDAFYVLEGEIELRLGPDVESVRAPAGTLGAAPPNLVHTFRNSSDSTAFFLNVHAPGAGFAAMLRARRDGRDEEAAEFDQHDPPGDGGRPLADAIVSAPGKGERIASRSSMLVKAGSAGGDGHFSLVETELPAGYPGPPRHLHRRTVEMFFVLQGAVTLHTVTHEAELAPGDFALVPPGVTHTFKNPNASPSRCVVLAAPGGIETFLREAAAAGPADYPHLGARFDTFFDEG